MCIAKDLQKDWVEEEGFVNILYLLWAWVDRFLGQLLCTYTHALWTVRYFLLWSRYKALHLLDWGNKIPALRKCLVDCCLSSTVSHLRFCEHSSFTSKKVLLFTCSSLLPIYTLFLSPTRAFILLLLATHWKQQKAYILD